MNIVYRRKIMNRRKKETKKFSLKTQKIDVSITDVFKAVETHAERPSIDFQITHNKLITDHVETNEDGEPRYQDVKLKHFLIKKDYIVNHAIEIVKSIVEYFNKHYGNTISHTSEAAVMRCS